MIHAALALTGTILVLLSLPGSLELALLTFSGILPARMIVKNKAAQEIVERRRRGNEPEAGR